MAAEYIPSFDFDATREKLKRIAETQVEIPMETLYEGIFDVIASRGGEKWRDLDEIQLTTPGGISILVGCMPREEGSVYSSAWIQAEGQHEKSRNYHVRRWEENNGLVHHLVEVDLDTDEENPLINGGNLAPARLYGLLAEANYHTPKEEHTDGDYSSAA